MSRLNAQAKVALAKFEAVLPVEVDTTDLQQALNEFVKGSVAIRQAAAGVASDLAEDLQGLQDGTITPAQFKFVAEMLGKRVIIIGDAAKVRLFRTALNLFIERLLAYLARVVPALAASA